MQTSRERIGPYVLISKLGKGAFGEVWLAERKTEIATTQVAIKIALDSEADSDIIKQEATLWTKASGHPNVLPIIEANIYDGQIVIVSEYAPDGSLSNWLAGYGAAPPSLEKSIELVLGILAGLQHLHEKRIVHRDLKPPNVLLQGDTPRLADFGISRALSSKRSGIIAGTPSYMAPEAFNGERNEQTDIWSAGVLLYQLLSGRLPFPQNDVTALMGAILNQEPLPLPSLVPINLQTVTMKALNKEPTHRYASAAEMRNALKAAERTINQGELPTIKDSEIAIETTPSASTVVIGPHLNSEARKATSFLWQTFKQVFTEVFSPEGKIPARRKDRINKWTRLKTWRVDYKSSPTACSFNEKTLASFYGPNANYDGERPFRINWENEKKEFWESRLYLWQIPTGAPVGFLMFESDDFWDRNRCPSNGAFSPDGKSFACSCTLAPSKKLQTRNAVRIWDTHTGEIRRETIPTNSDILSITFSPSGRYLALNCTDQTIIVWDLRIDKQISLFSSYSKGLSYLNFSRDEELLVGGSGEAGLRLWHWRSGELRFSALVGKGAYNFRAAFAPDGQMLAATNSEHQIMIWDTTTNELIHVLDNANFDGSFLSFSPDGLTLACGLLGSDKLGLRLVDVQTGEVKALLDENSNVCWSAFSSEGNLLVNWCTDKTMTLWKAD